MSDKDRCEYCEEPAETLVVERISGFPVGPAQWVCNRHKEVVQ